MSYRMWSKGVIFLFVLIVSSWSLVTVSFALDEETSDKYPAAGASIHQDAETKAVKRSVPEKNKRIKVTGFADLQHGYDNNVDLDSKRHEDGFLQSIANLDAGYKATDNVSIKSGIDVFNVTYSKYNVDNLLDVAPYTGFDLKIMPGLVLKNRCTFDYFSYPNRKENTYSGLVLSSALRYYIAKNIYHEGIYEYTKKWYPDRKITRVDATTGNSDRIDERYKGKYNVGMFFSRFFVKLSNEFSRNNSNDRFENYYDYWTYRAKPSIMYFISDKFYVNAGVTYKHTQYETRQSSESNGRTVGDDTFIVSTSFYYDLTKNVTFEVAYSYSENLSNDPIQRYSGSTVSSGLFYSF